MSVASRRQMPLRYGSPMQPGINPEQVDPAQDERHHRRSVKWLRCQTDAGDRAALPHRARHPCQHLAADISTAPAQRALSSGRIFARSSDDLSITRLAPSPFRYSARPLSRQRDDVVAASRQHIHRQAAEPDAGGAGNDHGFRAASARFFHAHDAQCGRETRRPERHRLEQRQASGRGTTHAAGNGMISA